MTGRLADAVELGDVLVEIRRIAAALGDDVAEHDDLVAVGDRIERLADQPEPQPADDEPAVTHRTLADRHLDVAAVLVERGHEPGASEAEKLSAQAAATYALMRARVHAELEVVDEIHATGARVVDAIERAASIPHGELKVIR